MDMVKANKTYKRRATAIRDKRILFSRENSKRILFSRENSKLCFGQPEMLRASQNKLAPACSRRRLPPKSEALMLSNHKPLNVQ
jgi:hypothetical protein